MSKASSSNLSLLLEIRSNLTRRKKQKVWIWPSKMVGMTIQFHTEGWPTPGRFMERSDDEIIKNRVFQIPSSFSEKPPNSGCVVLVYGSGLKWRGKKNEDLKSTTPSYWSSKDEQREYKETSRLQCRDHELKTCDVRARLSYPDRHCKPGTSGFKYFFASLQNGLKIACMAIHANRENPRKRTLRASLTYFF